MNGNMDVKVLLDAWEYLVDAYRKLPGDDVMHPLRSHDLRAQDIAEDGITIGARYDEISQSDPFFEEIRYDFGPLGAMYGEEAGKLWELQARRIKEAKKKYGIS